MGFVFAELVSFMGLVFTTLIQRRFRVIHGVVFANRRSVSEKHCHTVETTVETNIW